LNKPKVLAILNDRLLSEEGQMIAKSDMRGRNLDYGKPEDVQKYLEIQYALIEADNPKQVGVPPSSSSSSSGNGNKGSGGKTFTTTYTSHANAYDSGGKDNTIALTGFPAQPLNLPDGTVVSGSPQAIIRDKNGDLVLEYAIPVEAQAAVWKEGKEVSPAREKGLDKRYIPYDLYRADIENVFGRDISEDILGEAPNSGKSASSSGKTKAQIIQEAKDRAAGK
jgi:hypothetical protein